MTELEPQNNERVDQAGAVASTLCAIHCAICALLPAAFGALGLGMLLSQTAEWAFTIVAVSIAFGALVLSWRQHRSIAVAGLLSLGIVGLLASRVLEMGSDHHHGDHHADHHGEEHHDEGAHAETAHHDSVAEKHEDHHNEGHDEGHDEKHVADAHGHDHEGHSSEKHHDNQKEEHHGEHEEEGHEGEEGGHDDDNHTLGASVGIAGGMFLLFGHILNIGTSRKRKAISTEECCD